MRKVVLLFASTALVLLLTASVAFAAVVWVDQTGTDNDDTLEGSDTANDRIYGLAGNDTIDGKGKRDELHGDAGRDLLYGRWGADALYGDDGNDELYGGLGNEGWNQVGEHVYVVELNGGRGADKIYGRAGNDQLYADDYYAGGDAATDHLFGGEGDDYLQTHGVDGTDYLNGGPGNDFMRWWFSDAHTGGFSTVVMRGGEGDDYFADGAGNDTYWAGDGADLLYSGEGNDELTGGPGQDDIVVGNGDSLGGSDHVYAVDGEVDKIKCSPGTNEVIEADAVDVVTNYNSAGSDQCDTVNVH